jgi:CBS domain-containing protein
VSERQSHAAGAEARRVVPGRQWRPDEEHRQEMLLRYLGAVASASAARAAAEGPTAPGDVVTAERRPHEWKGPEGQRVRDVMDVPAVSIHGDMSFLDIARTLAHEHLGSVSVVDADDHVLGVVSESDLLAKAAVGAAANPPGRIGKLRAHWMYEKAAGATASALMTSPAIGVFPHTSVAEAAWLAARSRLKRLPVTDHKGRLVGVVHRNALLRALVRDDAKICEEIESRILAREFHLDPDAVTVSVEDGVVSVSGRVDTERIPQLLEEIREIDDVTDVVDHLTAVRS